MVAAIPCPLVRHPLENSVYTGYGALLKHSVKASCQLIYKMSGLPARSLSLDRGTLTPGAKADVLVLSPDALHSRATWTQQQLSPTGIDLILVNGEIAFEIGRTAGKLHCRMLRRGAQFEQHASSQEG